MTAYSTLYHSTLRPLYDAARGRAGHRLLKEAHLRQWLSPERLREFQWQELQKLLHHAYDFSPWYRSRFDDVHLMPNDIRHPADFARLPPITKADITAHRDEMLAANYRGKVYEHKTGGSTGVPLNFYVNRASYDWRVAVSMRGYKWANCEEGKRQFYVWGAPIGRPSLRQRLKTALYNTVLRRQMFSSFGFSEAAMAECVDRINAFQPATIVGYGNALSTLAQHIVEHRKDVSSPEAIITAAEGISQSQRTLIEKAFRAPVFASYGCREFMLIAMECERHEGMHISSDNLYVEVLVGDRPANIGEIGEVVVTDLHNFGMPFIRYKIGDLAVQKEALCSCGRGFPLLERVEGRVADAIRTRDGRVVPGLFFPHLFKEFDSVKQFQVIQKTLDSLIVRLVLRPGDHTHQLAKMEAEVHKILGPSITIQFEPVSEIPLTPSGKFRVSVSEL